MQHCGDPYSVARSGTQGLALCRDRSNRSYGSPEFPTKVSSVLAEVGAICTAIDGFSAGMGPHIADYARHCEEYGLPLVKLYELVHECLPIDLKKITASRQAAMTQNRAPSTPSQSETSSDPESPSQLWSLLNRRS